MKKLIYYFKKIFSKEKPSEIDQQFEFFKKKLVESSVTETIINREKQFVMPTDPVEFAKSLNFSEKEDDISTINFTGLPKDLKIKIKRLVLSETKKEIV